MKAFIAASSDQIVPVQKVLRRSRRSATATLPSEVDACRAIPERAQEKRRQISPGPDAKPRD